MKAASINTIACIVPTEKADKATLFNSYTINENTIDAGCQLSATVDSENLMWNFDRVVNDSTLLDKECSRLVESALEGYNAAYLSLSVSDGYRHAMNEQRDKNLKVLFDQFKSHIDNSKDTYKIEYAFLGMQNGECYDIRKKITRTNESMEKRDIDSIMKPVNNIEAIRHLMIERESTLPYLLSIKLTNTGADTIGRFVLIDLLYSPFAPSARDGTINALQNIVSALTTPKYNGLMQLGSSFLAKEISKYICGHNEMVIVLFLNNEIVNEIHSRDTIFSLSLVSSFTGMPVRSFPNENIHSNLELKKLRSEVKKLSSQCIKIEKWNDRLSFQLTDRNITIEKLKDMQIEFETKFPTIKLAKIHENEQIDIMLAIKEKQIQYLETSIMSKSLIHDFDLQQLKIEIAKLNTMLDIKEFSEKDYVENTKGREYPEHSIQLLEQRDKDLEAQLKELHKIEKELQEKLKDLRSNSTLEMQIGPEEVIDDETEEKFQAEIENLKNEITQLNQQVSEHTRNMFRETDSYKEKAAKLKEPLKELEKESREKKAAIKVQANEKMMALREKLEVRYAQHSEHLQNLHEAVEQAYKEANSDSKANVKGKITKKRKISPDRDEEDEEQNAD